MTSGRVAERLRHGAAVLVLLTAAWSGGVGKIGEDTKNDLLVAPWRFLGRSLHLWDPQVTWGVLQNQGYGYLFPMGPFFGLTEAVVPVWIAQRLWWTVILLAAYAGTWRLLRAFGYQPAATLHVAALAYTLCPRIVTTLGGLSAEALPVALAPAILVPLVNARAGRISPARAAAYSGVAILFCGGVNATATILAAVPAGLFLVSGHRWWRDRLVGWWLAAAFAASAWWLGPLLLLGGYSPPFLDWIENARTVALPVGLFDVVRGTTHWLGFVVTGVGPWWPAGFEIVSNPWLVVATATTAAAGLVGLSRRDIPHRRWLVSCLLIGALAMALPHSGPAASPAVGLAQRLLDGPLVPFRNIHKADPLVRLPLVIGLAHVLSLLPAWRPARGAAGLRAGVAVVLSWAVVMTASPAFQGRLTTSGTFTAMASQWVEAGRWLDRQAGSNRSLIVPASTFGEYTWGRTIDEPLRPLTEASYAVRDGVPLTPAGTIRLLDAVEQRLQTGEDLRGAAQVLRRLGVRYLVLRNDLDVGVAGTVPVEIARSALRSSPDLRYAAGFGPQIQASYTGIRPRSVEIYQIVGPVAGSLELWPASAVRSASGASEALIQLADAGLLTGPVVFDGDRIAALTPTERVETDAFRARARFTGARRGQDFSSSLTAGQVAGTRDYRPWEAADLRSAVRYGGGIVDLRVSSSVATNQRLPDVRPAHGPFAALDGQPGTGWLTYADPAPAWTVTFAGARDLDGLRLDLPDPEQGGFAGVAVPTRIRITTDTGTVDRDLEARRSSVEVAVPDGPTTRLRVEILATSKGPPQGTLTGLADVHIPGLTATSSVVLADPGDRAQGELTAAISLTAGDDGYDGCILVSTGLSCLLPPRAAEESGVLARSVAVHGAGEFQAFGTLVADPFATSVLRPLRPGVAAVEATSSRTTASPGQPEAAFDADLRTAWSPDLGDRAPALTVLLSQDVELSSLKVVARNNWLTRHRPIVRVLVDGREVDVVAAGADGSVDVTPTRGRVVTVTFVLDADDADAAASLEVAEIEVAGLPAAADPQPLATACGDGPRLVVNGLAFPTRVTGPAEAAIGLGAYTWEACAPIGLGALAEDQVEVHSWKGTQVRSAHWVPTGAVPSAALEPTALPATASAPGHWSATVAPSVTDRVLTLVENANPGWRATLGNQVLSPVTVDGFRQGFVVPEGAAGALQVTYAPDRTYRIALGVGGVLAVLLLAAATLLLRRRQGSSAVPAILVDADPRTVPTAVMLGGALVVGVVVAGWAGGVVTLAALLAAACAGRWGWPLAGLVASPIAVAAVVTIAQPYLPGVGPAAEITTRLAALAALVLAVTGPHVGAVARARSRSPQPAQG